jgi:uncharacterized membrane protein YciS (DUF1049 family)
MTPGQILLVGIAVFIAFVVGFCAGGLLTGAVRRDLELSLKRATTKVSELEKVILGVAILEEKDARERDKKG